VVFSSPIFLFLFLPLFLAGYYLTPKAYKSLFILVGSSLFYAWWRIDFLFLMLGITVWTYFISVKMWNAATPLLAKRWIAAGITVNLGTLGYFKYWNFGVDSFEALLNSLGVQVAYGLPQIILPIGISFYVFHTISYMIDVYRKEMPPARHVMDFLAFITLFPHQIAGPILRYQALVDQFENRTHTLDKFGAGAQRFMLGFAKKVLIADSVAPIADMMFALENPTATEAWLGAIAYTIQLFFDFSGYSDMAIGLGMMMGFTFPENFNRPYIAQSITEFWRRWHMTLSNWLRDYLYIPLGGNRKGTLRTYFNLFFTMLLGGLWHGANWTFVLWGAWHGAWLAIERAMGVKAAPESRNYARTAFTLLLIIFGWVLFRAANLDEAKAIYSGMIGANGWGSEAFGLSDLTAWQIKGMSLTMLLGGVFCVYGGPEILEKIKSRMPSIVTHIAVFGLFLLAVSRLLANSYSPFLYFQF
jgi:alginate O-acetyltransferase complex protein AlgI